MAGKFDTLQFESIIGRELRDEEKDKITLWEKGRLLAQILQSPVWQVVLEMLQSYPVHSLERLAAMDPGDRDGVLAEQAVAYAGNRIFLNFQEDVAHAVEASRSAPDFVSAALKGFKNPAAFKQQ